MEKGRTDGSSIGETSHFGVRQSAYKEHRTNRCRTLRMLGMESVRPNRKQWPADGDVSDLQSVMFAVVSTIYTFARQFQQSASAR